MDNKTLITNEYQKLKGQLVLSHYKVYQLIGIGEDEYDFYWLLYDGRKVQWATCVGSITQLKDKIDKRDYDDMVRIAELNFESSDNMWGAKTKTAEISALVTTAASEHRKKMETLTEGHSLIAGWHWDLI